MTDIAIMDIEETTARERLAEAQVHFRRQSEALHRANAHVNHLLSFVHAISQPLKGGTIWEQNTQFIRQQRRAKDLLDQQTADPDRERFKGFKRVHMSYFGVSAQSPQTPGGLGVEIKISRDGEEEFCLPAACCSIGINELPEDVHYIALALKNPDLPPIYMALDVKGVTELIRAMSDARDTIFAHNDRVLS